MAKVAEYARPASLEEALQLAGRPEAVVIGGGTTVNASPSAEPVFVVDLQAVDLGGIDRLDGGRLRIGATVTLQQLVDDEAVPSVVREAARREQPSTLRAQATVGGAIVAAGSESEVLAALLVHDTVVSVATADGVKEIALDALLAGLPLQPGRIVTAATIAATGRSVLVRAGRTPADRAIVAVAARRGDDGRRSLALSGVAATPILADGPEGLDPPEDFRGSSEYRRALAATLVSRALEGLS